MIVQTLFQILFQVNNEDDKYMLYVSGCSGNASGCSGNGGYLYNNGHHFTTRDRDNNPAGNANCADERGLG